jgi:hypothetical protein
MSLAVQHCCRTCHSYENVSACTLCSTAFYCSKKCQNLDWSSHKKFCLKNESKEEAIKRRERCLNIITAFENYVLKYLMKEKIATRPSFLLVREHRPPIFMPMAPLSTFKDIDIPLDEITYAELCHETNRKDAMPAMVVLHMEKNAKVFVTASAKWREMKATVGSMPMQLIVHIITSVLENEAKELNLGPTSFVHEKSLNHHALVKKPFPK